MLARSMAAGRRSPEGDEEMPATRSVIDRALEHSGAQSPAERAVREAWFCLGWQACEDAAQQVAEADRAGRLREAALAVKREMGLWVPRTENSNITVEQAAALEGLFAALGPAA